MRGVALHLTLLLLAVAPRPAAADPNLASAAPSPVPPPPEEPRPRLDLRTRIYVADFPQLAQVIRQDPALAGRADELQGRRTAAFALGGTAVAALLVLPLASLSDVSCEDVGMGLRSCTPQPRLAIAGAVIGLALGVAATVVAPSRGEILDLLNRWNLRHPDRPLVPDPWVGAVVGTGPAEAWSPPPPPPEPPPFQPSPPMPLPPPPPQ